jgi:hypothetical protein
LQEHLNNEQLDELLRYAPNGGERLASDRGISDEVQTHLNNCEYCQEKVQAHRELMEGLLLLKKTDVGLPRPGCPPADIWFEIAAGVDIDNVHGLLDHAGRCDHCGPLLRLAAEDCAIELTPQEENRIASLQSSSLPWQRELISTLCQTEPVAPVEAPDKERWWSRLRKTLSPLSLAFAASLAGLVALGVTDYRLAANLSTERTQAEVEISRLQTNLARQNPHASDATSNLNGTFQLQYSSPPPSPAAPPHSVNASPIAYLSLNSGMTRGPGQLSRIAIPPGTEIVKITVQVPNIPHGTLQEQLLTADGNRIWSQTLEPSATELHTQVLSIFLPSYLLKPNDYQIVISRESADGIDRLGSRPFRVIP